MLFVSEPSLGEEEKAVLAQVVDSGWITMGDRVRAFESAFASEHGVPDSVAVSSCTAGLHLVMQALGIGTGDEVLVPSLTFVATVNAVLYVGATPVFVDIESLEHPHIGCADATAKCSAKTKAVVIMHYAGYLADSSAWQEFTRSRGLLLIEDAAHAVGADGAGIFGDAAVFSFYGNKNMTTAEGGMVVARAPDVLDTVRHLRSHGMTLGSLQRTRGNSLTYDVMMLGYNYRMDDLRAAIGLAQLEHLKAWNKRRQALTDEYRRRLLEYGAPVVIPFSEQRPSSHHIFPVLLPEGCDRPRVVAAMREAGIQTTVHYPPVHQLSLYESRFPGVKLLLTEEFARRELTLPLFPRLEEQKVDFVACALATALKELTL